jgi:hypothetical protein
MQPAIHPSLPAKTDFRRNAGMLIIAFILSRLIIHFLGLRFQYDAIYDYWQYLDIRTLRNNLLAGVWYDHTQPPVFNLFLGAILKIAPASAPWIFAAIFKLIPLVNALLLLRLLQRITAHRWLPVILSLLYLLSPGTMVFENELFYTSLITLLFLISISYLLNFTKGINWSSAIGFFLPLTIICLTRSMYHVVFFLLLIAVIIYFRHRKQVGLNKLVITAALSLLITGGWYMKNYFIFGQFSASSWLGMNMARNIFHDNEVKDPSRIESIPPFSPIADYKPFITGDLEKKYAGLNDIDLLLEMKNDSFRNEKHINFLEVSEQYKKAGIQHIKQQPLPFVKNVMQSAITFFAPATRYTLMEEQARKIKYYDAVYSFNLSQFASGKQQRRIALTLSALPQLLIFVFTFWILLCNWCKRRQLSAVNLFIGIVLLYAFCVSSLVEHYENMRFRFELEPLFLILLAQACMIFFAKRKLKD